MNRFWLLPFTLCLMACKKETLLDCANSTGPIRTEKREVQPFEHLVVRSDIDVHWHQSAESYVEVTCGRNLLRKVVSRSDGRTLTLENTNRCNWVRSYGHPMKISVFSPSPHEISLLGYGQFFTEDTLKASPLSIFHYGASEARLWVDVRELFVDFSSVNRCTIEGQADKSSFSVQNFGKLKAENTKVKKLDLVMDGENDLWIWVEDSLLGKHKSTRNVFLKGRPARLVELKSTGKIIEEG